MSNGSPTSSHKTILVSGTRTLLNVNMSNVKKLTSTNYLMWNRQVRSLLDGYDLAGHVDGSMAISSPTLTNDGQVTVNNEYSIWKRQDKLLYSALLGTITAPVQAILATTTTAADIWHTIGATYTKPSRGHMLQLRQQLKPWTKGTNSIDDHLALLEKPLDHEDKIEFILEGLSEDYKMVVDQIAGRDTTPSVTEIHENLIQHELKLLRRLRSSRQYRLRLMLQSLVATTITHVVMADPTGVLTTAPATGTIAGKPTTIKAIHHDHTREGVKSVVYMVIVLVPALSSSFMEPQEARTSHQCLRMLHGNLVLTWPLLQRTTPTTGF